MMSWMAVDDPFLKTRRWTRIEYEQLVDRGVFRKDERLELLDGLLVVREPQSSRHGATVAALCEILARAFGTGYHVRPQLPVALDDTSEPEPDIVVVRGGPWDYVTSHPSAPVLLVEIAETSLSVDRAHKGGLYARAGFADYWIVNLPDTVLEIYREPAPAATARSGAEYRAVERFTFGATVAPLAAPTARIAVADLLPPA
jgi:Uma2 family endonuclease